MPRAIAKGYKRLGVMPCLVCAREIPVKRTDGGKLSCACNWCDAPIYISAHTEAFALVMARVKLDEAAADPGRPASDPAIAQPLAAASSAPATAKAPPVDEKKAPPRRSFAGPLFGGG